MFNIFEQPWLLFAAAFIALLIVYILTLERSFYWLSLLILICLAVLNLVLKSRLFFLNPTAILVLKIVLPIAAAALSAILIWNVVQLKDKASFIWFVPLAIMIGGFGLDWLVKTDMEQIKSILNSGRLSIEREDKRLLDSIISDKYEDSIHQNKQALLRHFDNYFGQRLCESITNTFTDISKKQNEAEIITVFFVTFGTASFPVTDYGVLSCLVNLRVKAAKEDDGRWRIRQVEIAEVDNQPFSWSAVGR